MPTLNYATPLHTFSTGNLSYTATKDCYLLGTTNASDTTISIDGTVVYKGWVVSGISAVGVAPPLTKIKAGSTVIVSGQAPNLHIFEAIS